MSTTTPPRSSSSTPNVTLVIISLAFAGIVVSLMQTLLIPIIPQLPTLLDARSSDTSWVITATLLAAAVATPVVGRLGDMFGKRRMLLISVAILIVGSVVGALSESLAPLIVGRALQGLSAGVVPLGISILRDVLPKEKLGSATAMISASLGVGGALGLPISAVIADNWDWHMLFWVSTVLGVVVLISITVVLPESKVRTGGAFDHVGAITLSTALVGLLLAISKGADWGWTSGMTAGMFALAVVAFAVWGWWELRTTRPLVDLRVSAGRQVLLTNLAAVVFGIAMFAMSLVFPQMLQLPESTGYGLGKSLLVVGLVMAPSGFVMMLVSPISAKISASMGPRVTLMAGAIVVAGAYVLAAFTLTHLWEFILVSILIGAGIGLAYGAMPALIMGAVPATETAAANSLNTLMRSVGTSFASAIAGVVLAGMTLSNGVTPSKNAFTVILLIAAGGAVAAFVFAAFLPGRSDGTGEADHADRELQASQSSA
ncbi:MFS transporter [Williamsia maris]|uniref:Drug resistance transporter, EmrB/QacA subfamily n=1 Tax=Williamsia maris TaxID=72806 RepID=A0ABT1HFD2_9NOCA|nr:MFS transporter [Williamsia maris]MCP2176418.1 drug resistance transporter, EmrB/QacA subfamily [Williamsia maris]